MPFVLRKIRLARWDTETILRTQWLPEGEIVADPLGDLSTSDGGTLSVWHINEDESNRDRVLVALALTGDSIASMDYMLFDQRVLDPIGVRIEQSRGATADDEANAQWHRDLVRLTGHKLVELAKCLLEKGKTGRMNRRQLLQLVRRAVQTGEVDSEKLSERIRRELAGIA